LPECRYPAKPEDAKRGFMVPYWFIRRIAVDSITDPAQQKLAEESINMEMVDYSFTRTDIMPACGPALESSGSSSVTLPLLRNFKDIEADAELCVKEWGVTETKKRKERAVMAKDVKEAAPKVGKMEPSF